jgi:hypothetical protein
VIKRQRKFDDLNVSLRRHQTEVMNAADSCVETHIRSVDLRLREFTHRVLVR